jgi:pimeloyl-ACP methyl ester carboxylesterase
MKPSATDAAGERIVTANGVDLCMQTFGEPANAPVLLVMGMGASMLWWDEQFCRMLAARDRFVIRYDHRDTGRSVTYEAGRAPYTGADLVADAVGVLDACNLRSAHVVGVSAGGALAQRLALDYPGRARSLVLISTSPATNGERALPSATSRFTNFFATAQVDWSDPTSVIEYLLGYARMLAGDLRPFDEDTARRLVTRDLERARDFGAARNHDTLADGEFADRPIRAITVPTLVVHGTNDPMFPIEHGAALADEIPGARLRTLDGAGHGVEPADWKVLVAAIAEHTGGSINDGAARPDPPA